MSLMPSFRAILTAYSPIATWNASLMMLWAISFYQDFLFVYLDNIMNNLHIQQRCICKIQTADRLFLLIFQI